MDWTELEIGPNDAGRRVDTVIRRVSRETGLSGLFAALRKGLVRINEQKIAPNYRVKDNDKLQIASFLLNSHNQPNPQDPATLPEKTSPWPVLFEDHDILAVAKPAGVLVHDGPDSMEARLRPYLGQFSHGSLSFTPGPLHRLDRNTSGVICFGKSLQGARNFSRQLKAGKLRKIYLAIVHGSLPANYTSVWSDQIERDSQLRQSRIKTSPHSKAALCVVKCIGSASILDPQASRHGQKAIFSLLAMQLLTGRTHQLRLQAAKRGHPIVGDTKYGKKDGRQGQPLFLHAAALILPDQPAMPNQPSSSAPPAGQSIFIHAPLPQNWFESYQLFGYDTTGTDEPLPLMPKMIPQVVCNAADELQLLAQHSVQNPIQ